jgi:ankyrin repeat protein
MEAILARGAPVDAPDAQGVTALMKSIQAGRAAAAALLRRYGASLDQRDAAGVSARDMALSNDDPQLNQALGLDAEDQKLGSQ